MSIWTKISILDTLYKLMLISVWGTKLLARVCVHVHVHKCLCVCVRAIIEHDLNSKHISFVLGSMRKCIDFLRNDVFIPTYCIRKIFTTILTYYIRNACVLIFMKHKKYVDQWRFMRQTHFKNTMTRF